jgi:RHS repeat-associated protein
VSQRAPKGVEGSGPTEVDTIEATYDALGRPDQLKRGTTILSDFNWNPDGTLLSRVDGDAGAIGTTSFTYDWADRLLSANLPDGFSTAVPTFAWRADGLVKSRTFDTGTALAFTYDRAKRLAKIAKGSLTLEQAYDRDGNVISESRSLGVSGDAGTGTQTFGYDELNRVLSSTGLGTGHNFTYEYDHDGNRTKKDDGTTTWTYGYDRTDQLSSTTGGPTVVGYNAFGDMTSKPEDTGSASTTWTWDIGGKLTGIDRPGAADDATFTFDALGRFRTRVLASSTDTYSYLGTTETVLRVRNDPGSNPVDVDSIVTSAGDRLGVASGSTVNWFLPDPHGSIAGSLLSNEATVVNAIRYDAWGDTLATGSAGGTAVGANSWKYQGRLDLSPSGLGEPLYDMSARFYAPSLGVFTQLDSVMGSAQNPLSMNRFLYAHANPATLIDPTGHAGCVKGKKCALGDATVAVDNDGGYSVHSKDRPNKKWSSPMTKRPPKATPKADNWQRDPYYQCQASKLNCSVYHLDQMSPLERLWYVEDFQRSHDTGGWFNAIEEVLKWAAEDQIFQGGSGWSSLVDAHILAAIQDGKRLQSDLPAMDGRNPGGEPWRDFFIAYEQRASPLELEALWGGAEQLATNYGDDLASRERTARLGERSIRSVTDLWRGAVAAAPALDALANELTESPCFAGPWACLGNQIAGQGLRTVDRGVFDPRSRGLIIPLARLVYGTSQGIADMSGSFLPRSGPWDYSPRP